MAGDNEEERDGLNHTPLRIPGLLYVSVKMENPNLTLSGDLLPHVSGSFHLGPSWDPSKAVILTLTHFIISFLLFWVSLSSSYSCCFWSKNFSFLWSGNPRLCGS